MGMVRNNYEEVESRCGLMVPAIRTRENAWQPQEGELLVDRHIYCERCYPHEQ